MASIERNISSENSASKAADGWLSKFREYTKQRRKKDNWSMLTGPGSIALGVGLAGWISLSLTPLVIGLLAGGGAAALMGVIGETRAYSKMRKLEAQVA